MVNVVICKGKELYNFMNQKAVSMSGIKRVAPFGWWSWLAESLKDFWCSVYFLVWVLKPWVCLLGGNSSSSTLHVLFCTCAVFQESLLPPHKKQVFLVFFSSLNKCWTNMCRIKVWRGVRIVAWLRERIILSLAWAYAFSLEAVHFIVVHDLALLLGIKASLAFFLNNDPIFSANRTEAIALPQMSLLVRVAWLCQVSTPSWRW